MTQDAQGLLARMRSQRETWSPVGAFEVLLRRPLDAELADFAGAEKLKAVAVVTKYTVAWRKVTEATLLGAAVGADIEVAYTPELWAEYLGDHLDECRRLHADLITMINSRHAAESAAAKN